MADYIKKIRTKDGDKQIDYNALANLPEIPSVEGLATEDYVDEQIKLVRTEIPSIEGVASEEYVDNRFEELVGAAPEALDTLEELATALNDDASFSATVVNELSKKADKEEVNALTQSLETKATKDELSQAISEMEVLETDENGNVIYDNGLKMFKDFSMQGWIYDWVEDQTHEDGGYYLYAAIEGPFSSVVKIAEIGCGLDGGEYIRDGFSLTISESYSYEADSVDLNFPPEYFDYEIQPAETITEEYYDVFCEGKFVIKSDGRVYSLNSELQDLPLWGNPSNIVEGWELYDDYLEIPLKVIVTSTVDKLKAYQEYLKSLEDGGDEA